MPLADGPDLEATGAESVKEVHRLVVQVVSTLNDPIFEQHASLSLRLARAHALTLLDHLEKLVESR